MSDHWREGNSIDLLINGEEFFPRVFECISKAKREVLLETFILNEDKIGKELQQVLISTAKRGVRVEVTVDDYGTADLSTEFINDMLNAGVKLHVFDPTPRLLGVRVNMFRRLHRKIVVVDAEDAFVGGINYSADHLASFGPTAKQDYAVHVRGPIVLDIHEACLKLLRQGSPRKKKHLEDTKLTPAIDLAGNSKMLLAVRDNVWHTRDIERHYLRAIHGARHRLLIANAYFFPGYRLLRALRRAARRGVEVTLILQGRPDMAWVSMCTRLLYSYLLKEGIVIHEYCQRPLHGKVALADDEWATIGSSNLDPLSLALNLEANLVIEDRAFNQRLYKHLQGLAKAHCKPIDVKIAEHGYWWRLPLIFLSFHFLRSFPKIAGWFPTHSPEVQLLSPDSPSTPVKSVKKATPEKKSTADKTAWENSVRDAEKIS
ncbi:cardiolipin synthase B [Cellvibrio zantedeschiae]|uniref:Cardiolipin synthase B n=1 Tax=Cellvibrio zantedeschiae TaxID=1237077 RepID=A0ABQ3AU74_9GAMM|nr:cardiolipin synthase ClsB [Cellvibrio zantedeschiae]GGY67340.1 cardiolipin synthase B [Cellvibrio zantedeschiae]